MLLKCGIWKLERTDEEKARRHREGDCGASFKHGKVPWIDWGGVSPTITTLSYHDITLFEVHEN